MSNIYKYFNFDKTAFVTESVYLGTNSLPMESKAYVMESLSQSVATAREPLPHIIYPLIHCIRAESVTRNKTFYPAASLLGDAESYTGVTSWTNPVRTPWIRDHNTSGGVFGGISSEIYGRTTEAFWTTSAQTPKGVVAAIPAITDPYAIERILDGRWLSVSIGCSTESVKCSICGFDFVQDTKDMFDAGCGHEKGKFYQLDGEELEKECYLVVGPIQNRETSFVTTPSDLGAKVVDKSVDPSMYSIFAGNPKQEFIFNMADPQKRNLLEVDDTYIRSLAEKLCQDSMNIYQEYTNTRTTFIMEESYKEEEDPSLVEKKLATKARKGLSDSSFALVYTDKKTGKKVRRFPINDLTHAQKALQLLPKAKNLTSAQRATIKRKAQAALKRFGGGKKNEAELEQLKILLEDFDGNAQEQPEQIEISPENYELLFEVIEELEDELDEAYAEIESLMEKLTAMDKETKETEETPQETEVQPEVTEETPQETKEEETPVEEESTEQKEQETPEDKEEVEKPETPTESEPDPKLVELLARTVATMKITLNTPDARGKTADELTNKLKAKGTEYLQGTLEDLNEILANGPVVNVEKLEEAIDPTKEEEEESTPSTTVTYINPEKIKEDAQAKAREAYDAFLSGIK